MFDTTVLEVISTEYVLHLLNGCEGSFANENIAGCLQKADNFFALRTYLKCQPPLPIVLNRTHLLDPLPPRACVLNE